VLRPGGLFAFSAEAATTEDYRLGVMGRYAHSADYLHRLAAENGFVIELLRATRIRFEHRQPVAGWLTVWRVPQSAAG
jgi:predicted TPR repeat methyltransferase